MAANWADLKAVYSAEKMAACLDERMAVCSGIRKVGCLVACSADEKAEKMVAS